MDRGLEVRSHIRPLFCFRLIERPLPPASQYNIARRPVVSPARNLRTDEQVDSGHALAVAGDEGADGELLRPSRLLRRDPRGDDELHAALVVLRGEVVPVARERDDLADDRGDRLLVAEDAALDLDTGDDMNTTSAKETWRKSDGDESLADKVGNAGDELRR